MNLSQSTALIILLIVTFLWGSWFQVVKHTGDYPIYALLSWLYVFSIFIVWGSIALLHKQMVPDGVFHEIASDIPRTLFVLLCGALYAVGMQLQLTVVGRVGLILSSSITSTCSILCGILLSSFLGGIPEGASFASILFAAVLLILGTVICQASGKMRTQDINGGKAEKRERARGKDIALLIFSSGVLAPFYSMASSVGLKTELRPDGFSSFTCMGILCIGALIGTSIFTAVRLTKDKKWGILFHPGVGMKRILLMALIAAFCHFGGNVLHAIAAPVVSVVIATGIGYSFGVWAYLWGICYGEFKGAKGRTYMTLALGVALFLAGVVILTFNMS